MQSPDGFLVMALINMNLIRLERVTTRVHRIAKWRDGITIFCLSSVFVFGLLARMPSQEVRLLFFFAFCFPMTFGLLAGIAVMKRARNSYTKEHGVFASLILENIAEMNPSYESTFFELLSAIMDEDGPYAVLLADELDPCGPHVKEFTRLVREAFG